MSDFLKEQKEYNDFAGPVIQYGIFSSRVPGIICRIL